MRFEYPIAFGRETDGTLLISCRDLPEVISQAGPKEDATDVAEGAIQAAIEYRIGNNLDIPVPSSQRKKESLIQLPAETAAKAALYIVMRQDGITKLELARRLKINEKEVRRMLDPGHATKIPRIAQALSILGHKLRLELV